MGQIADYRAAHGRITYGSGAPGVLLVQRALMADGAVLVADGEFGSITEMAVKVFQSRSDMPPVGWVGIRTAELLDRALLLKGGDLPPPLPTVQGAPWLSYMRAITGTRELPGAADSPIIMSWNNDISRAFPEMQSYATGSYTHDLIPWCGQCAAACMVHCNPAIRPPFVKGKDTDCYLWADSWSRWGAGLSKPVTGCVMTFKRSGGSHVTFLEKMDGNDFCYVRGGNQSDMVNVTRRSMDGFTAARWPAGIPLARDLVADISNIVKHGSEA